MILASIVVFFLIINILLPAPLFILKVKQVFLLPFTVVIIGMVSENMVNVWIALVALFPDPGVIDCVITAAGIETKYA